MNRAEERAPSVIVLAGPNGAGKSTAAPEAAALPAGRIMLARLKKPAVARVAGRVRQGGHDVPNRRLYNAEGRSMLLVARGSGPAVEHLAARRAPGGRNAGMNNRSKVDIARAFEEGDLIDEAIEEAARDAAIQHKRAGLPLVVWRRGRVAYIPPEAINDDGAIRDDDPENEAHDEDDDPASKP